jgi:hypothetical protein
MENLISSKEKKRIDKICKGYNIIKYKINSDSSIDVMEDVNIHSKEHEWLYVKFNEVNGCFDVSGCAMYDFYNFPNVVNGNLILNQNRFKTLNDFNTVVEGNINISENALTSLKGLPKELNGSLNVSDNNIRSLDGAPKIINGYFDIHDNYLSNLKGFPTVNGSVDISYNENITTLEGLPTEINGSLNFNGLNLTTLEYVPKINEDGISLYNLQKLESTYCGTVDLPPLTNFRNITRHKNFPKLIADNEEHLVLILKYQRYFQIWNPDATLNVENAQVLLDEIKDGLL